jgi:hypothetical protein
MDMVAGDCDDSEMRVSVTRPPFCPLIYNRSRDVRCPFQMLIVDRSAMFQLNTPLMDRHRSRSELTVDA